MADKDRGTMRDEDYVIVRRFHSDIIRELDSRSILDRLFSSFLFDSDDLDQVRSEHDKNGRRAGSQKIMEILYHSGADAFPKFLECLRKAGYAQLVRRLEEGIQEANKERSLSE
ncbi:hypothetical protein SNE40_015751 [Patella caerulea]|uniref:CARD domain-containing protein n=1 Tax=Patella caerulea TaxID=87958 RepID=A0AAN8PSI4_PATCE